MGCAMFLYRMLSAYSDDGGAGKAALSVLIYDFCAFVSELPLGLFIDRTTVFPRNSKNINGLLASAGCMIIALIDIAAAFSAIPSPLFIPAAIVMGLANAAFHSGAGIDIINLSDRKTALSGIFISTGAVGLFLGTNAGRTGCSYPGAAGIALILMSLSLLWLYMHDTHLIPHSDNTEIKTGYGYLLAAVFLLFLVIFYRSFLGFASKYSWRSGFMLGLAAVTAVFFGKFFGGMAADRFGWKKTIVSSLLLCSAAAVFSDSSPVAGCIVLFLFNMTMPVAMMGLANLLPKWKGVAFGLNTAALFLGFVSYHMTAIPVTGIITSPLILLSAVILLTALHIAPEMEDKWD